MDKQFLIILVSVIIIGFSASTYIFSQGAISIEFDGITDSISAKKAKLINEINKCISQNSIADGSITMNSFENNLLSNIIKQVEDAKDNETLDSISEQIYTMTLCKQE